MAALVAVSCSIDEPMPPEGGNDDPNALGSITYTGYAHNLRKVRKEESLHLWGLYRGDTAWTRLTKLVITSLYSGDSARLSNRIKYYKPLEDLEKLMISVEMIDSPSSPTARLIAGNFVGGNALMRPENMDGVGEFSAIEASVIFTSNSTDTSRYRREFYFARKENGELVPSINTLPQPNGGWKYAIWMLDSNYYPQHRFFYGFLESPELPDTRNTKDSYPLPGGFEGPQLNRLGASLRVTLEPPTFQQSLKTVGPSPYTVLFARLPKHIQRDETLPMINTDSSGLPVVRMVLQK